MQPLKMNSSFEFYDWMSTETECRLGFDILSPSTFDRCKRRNLEWMRYETSNGVIKLQELQAKRWAATADLPTNYLCSETVSGMKFETRTKLGCQIKSLKRMAQRSRQAVNRYPCNPRDLEQLYLLALSCFGTPDTPTQTRCSFLFITPSNTSALRDAEHLVVDGTWKSSPSLFTQLF